MQGWKLSRRIALALFAALFVVGAASPEVSAETATSPHYQITETTFNSGSSQNNCSSSYCSQISIGDLSVGDGSSAGGTTATFGSVTPDQPSLDVIVESGSSNLGKLDAEHVASKTMVVKIRSYLSNGYILQINGESPKYGTRKLQTFSSPRAATPGTEMFGINAVANTTPSVGANPVQVPSADFSFGEVNSGYNTPNQFKYVNGDVVAHSTKASGETDFTISMVVTISNATPAGNYAGDFSAVVTPVY